MRTGNDQARLEHTQPMPRPRRKSQRMLWLPREHGAWAWLTVPILAAGIVGQWHAWFFALAGCVFAGYGLFNAASWRRRMPLRRRAATTAPLVVYASIAAVMFVLVLVWVGWTVTIWFALLGVLLMASWWADSTAGNRSWVSGLATATCASLLAPLAMQPDFLAAVTAPYHDLVATWLIVWGYIAGTVFSVKSLIRERGSVRWHAVAVTWHVLATVGAAICAGLGVLPWVWAVFFAATAIRAAILPLRARQNPLQPRTIGLIEIGFSIMLLIVAASTGVG